MEELKYPIGKFTVENSSQNTNHAQWINDIASFPSLLASLTAELTDDMLEKTYRPGGWTIRQIVHHCADSHINAFIRFKLALTEPSNPAILGYDQDAWAQLPDSRLPIAASIHILAGLHERWSVLLRKMTPEEYEKGYLHSEQDNRLYTLNTALALYSWHGRHHLEHIRIALKG